MSAKQPPEERISPPEPRPNPKLDDFPLKGSKSMQLPGDRDSARENDERRSDHL